MASSPETVECVEPFVFMAVSYDEGHVQGFQGQCARSAKEKACLAAARLSMRDTTGVKAMTSIAKQCRHGW